MHAITANNYSIFFNHSGYEALNDLIAQKKYSSIFIIVDSNTNEHCVPQFLGYLDTDIRIEIIEFEAGEAQKKIDTCIEIWNVLTELGADRKSLIINVGGGVVTDLGGFVAVTFKRGLDFVSVPTTLLGMVDASIGGKTGIDLGAIKNQIGLIATPQLVLIDTNYLDTLPQLEMRSGLAEILKHGLIADLQYWQQFLDLSQLDLEYLDQIIFESIIIKNNIVKQDPTEKGIRKSLNFGHTLGHAIESYFLENESKTTLLHGEAIAVGMVLESYLSLAMKLISIAEYLEIKTILKDLFGTIDFNENDIESIIEQMVHDKKNESGMVQFVLLNGIGNVLTNQTISNEMIKAAFIDYSID